MGSFAAILLPWYFSTFLDWSPRRLIFKGAWRWEALSFHAIRVVVAVVPPYRAYSTL